MVLAKLVQAAAIEENDRVLDVGAATGYSAALLGRLAGSVVALEEDAALTRAARDALAAAGVGNAEVVSGPLVDGWQKGAPYDVILIDGAVEILPDAFARQLKDGGRLVCVQGAGPAGKAMFYRSASGNVSGRPIFDAAAPLLPGFAKPETFVF
jgi:protein-L-isoaspartate(D-aspartate) O-methyltransferase